MRHDEWRPWEFQFDGTINMENMEIHVRRPRVRNVRQLEVIDLRSSDTEADESPIDFSDEEKSEEKSESEREIEDIFSGLPDLLDL